MFENLSDRLQHSFKLLSGQARLTEQNLAQALTEVRKALLEADVALPVVTDFISAVRAQAIGQEVPVHLKPDQMFIQIVQQQLQHLLGEAQATLNLAVRPPAVIMVAGLTGTGKTSTVGKLCHYLGAQKKRRLMAVSTDVYRPAAREQLAALAETAGVHCFQSELAEPVEIARAALLEAQKQFQDVLIVDTAGRSVLDVDLMAELKAVHEALTPAESLLVLDAMAGQDAATATATFQEVIQLTGLVLTKMDGDARGGAALSARAMTGCPIKFIGVGEKLTALEVFHPDRIASRILGMGDMLSLIEEAAAKVDQKKAARLSKKIKKGRKFDLYDFQDQLQQLDSLGGIDQLMGKMPMADTQVMSRVQKVAGNSAARQMRVILGSMTAAEKLRPDIIAGSRKKRIAAGSGTSIQDVNKLLKQHKMMQKAVKKMKGQGLQKMAAQLDALPKMMRSR